MMIRIPRPSIRLERQPAKSSRLAGPRSGLSGSDEHSGRTTLIRLGCEFSRKYLLFSLRSFLCIQFTRKRAQASSRILRRPLRNASENFIASRSTTLVSLEPRTILWRFLLVPKVASPPGCVQLPMRLPQAQNSEVPAASSVNLQRHGFKLSPAVP
jgi:hypothetical protein